MVEKAIISHLRSNDPNLSPSNLENGQIAFNVGLSAVVDPCRNLENHYDIFMFIGNGSDSRIDQNGLDLTSTIVGSPKANKGWIRFSLDNRFIQGNATITGDQCILGDLQVQGQTQFNNVVCPFIINCDSTPPSSLIFSSRLNTIPVFDIFGDRTFSSNPISFSTNLGTLENLFSIENGINSVISISEGIFNSNSTTFRVNSSGIPDSLNVTSGKVSINNFSYSLPINSPINSGNVIVSTTMGDSEWSEELDGGVY